MTEQWYKDQCPNCKATNWVCNGNPEDLTGIDIDAVKCRECEHIFFLGDMSEEFYLELYGLNSVEEASWTEGRKNPE